MSMSKGTGKTTTTTGMFPNVYGNTGFESSGITAGNISSLLQQASPFQGAYEQAVLNPSYAPTSASEQNILNSLMDLTASRGAVRGLGAPTQESLATAIAPTLEESKQNNINNLMNAIQTQIAELTAKGGLGLELAGLQMPQPYVGSEGKQSSMSSPGCCFIFIEAYDGKLLDVVRKFRNERITERNRRGYYRLADKIIPLMQKSKFFKGMVKFCMTDPMVSYGKYYYGIGKLGFIFKPIGLFWMFIFNYLGRKNSYIRKNKEVI